MAGNITRTCTFKGKNPAIVQICLILGHLLCIDKCELFMLCNVLALLPYKPVNDLAEYVAEEKSESVMYPNNLRQHDRTRRLLTYSLSSQEFRLPFGQRFEFSQLWFEKYHGKEGKCRNSFAI